MLGAPTRSLGDVSNPRDGGVPRRWAVGENPVRLGVGTAVRSDMTGRRAPTGGEPTPLRDPGDLVLGELYIRAAERP